MKTTVITIALAMMTVVAFGQENQQTKATDKITNRRKGSNGEQSSNSKRSLFR